jgi:hypothetical protein
MKTRKISAVVVAFALIAMIARPQIIFAQAPGAPIKGSWDAVKAIPPGDQVVARLRNGQTLKGSMISALDTVLTLERRNNATDVNRGDVLRIYHVVSKSDKKGVFLGFLIGTGVGALVGVLLDKRAAGEGADITGLSPLVFGFLGALIGTGMGSALSGRTKRLLIYETK